MKILTLNTHSLAEENATEKMELFAGILEKTAGGHGISGSKLDHGRTIYK